ncbi:MAG: MBL fold metallo-hydrolase [Burkholderiales bacterium]
MRDATSAAVVDPGDAKPVIDHLDHEGLQLVAILNTHRHADHVGGNRELLQRWKARCSSRMTTALRRHHTALRAGKNYSPALWHRVRNHGDSGPHESHIAFYGGGPLFCGHTLLPSDAGAPPRALRSRCTILSIGLRRYSITRASIADTSTRSNIRFATAAEPGNGALVSLKARDHQLQQSCLRSDRHRTGARINPFMRVNAPEIIASARRNAGKTARRFRQRFWQRYATGKTTSDLSLLYCGYIAFSHDL